jgi:hypothetical protein
MLISDKRRTICVSFYEIPINIIEFLTPNQMIFYLCMSKKNNISFNNLDC